ncbi:MAG: VWA domain-containing protein [Desulfuromonas sp.]|nr:VWA domain-containing protein [Desulfuromonas sp.]
MIQFAWPWAIALLPLPYLIYRWMPRAEQASHAALWVPNLAPFTSDAAQTGSVPRPTSRLRLWLTILCWLLLVLACSRPQWLGQALELPVSGRDLMMAVDLSGSMQIEDFELRGNKVNRLTALKAVAGEFIRHRPGDRLGLILFGDQPYVQTPLTFDHTTLTRLLNETVIGLAGKKTAIGDAVGLALKRLSSDKGARNVLILLTDGANTSGQIAPEKAAQLAADMALKIYTIGLGAETMETGVLFFKRTVNPSADLDETTLRRMAEMTGGQYFRARDTAELAQIYQQLDLLEPVEKEKNIYRPLTDLYLWPLGVTLFLASLLLLGSRSRGWS